MTKDDEQTKTNKLINDRDIKEINEHANNENNTNNRKSSYQVKFESKQGQDKFKKEIMEEFKKDKVLTFRDMSHLSYFGMKKDKKKFQQASLGNESNLEKRQQLTQ